MSVCVWEDLLDGKILGKFTIYLYSRSLTDGK